MRKTPPHILLTNYSMLEYLLIRPDDSPLFDRGSGEHWQFIVLDEAHQYRGAKGMEMGMLVRRLKQRVQAGGRSGTFSCIATSATITSSQGENDKQTVAEFATELFGERFTTASIVFGESQSKSGEGKTRRYHSFLRALEGAFLVHQNGEDHVLLNRSKSTNEDGSCSKPLEIALCRECGQHYYVGRESEGILSEADRDPSHSDFGVEFYMPSDDGKKWLCRQCGRLTDDKPSCKCEASIKVKKCEARVNYPDQLKECEACGYTRGGVGDPVSEIVHGSDGPNTVIATALQELLPTGRRKVLAFADSRQEAAFFAWYAEDSYQKIRDRNLILRAITSESVSEEGLSIDDLQNRLYKVWEKVGLFRKSETSEGKKRRVLASIYREAITSETRLSLSGVGLVQWSVEYAANSSLLDNLRRSPWHLTDTDANQLIRYLLDQMRVRRALSLPDRATTPAWSDISDWPQSCYSNAPPNHNKNVLQWGSTKSAIVNYLLPRILSDCQMSESEKKQVSSELMLLIWRVFVRNGRSTVLCRSRINGAFQLDSQWLRVKPTGLLDTWECTTCATLSNFNIRGICPRNKCPGTLVPTSAERFSTNHYRQLYENPDLPPELISEEHTAQIDAEEARERQDRFKNDEINLLSSSTTFEVGVDLGDLETVFLRNVPPEPFNYAQRAGRAGRRDSTGLVMTYCRRNPHDLYHYEDPENRMIHGQIHAPRLQMRNEKIIRRHIVAVVLSEFFRQNKRRFQRVKNFVGEWSAPRARKDVHSLCETDKGLLDTLLNIVPSKMHSRLGLNDGTWIDQIAGDESRLALCELEVCTDYIGLEDLRKRFFLDNDDKKLSRVGDRMRTVESEPTLNFLSRKAIIPKYGFPVDVVELEVQSKTDRNARISLQRDLSQAIAEYAPGGTVIADKREWKSCGIKKVPGRACTERYYRLDSKDARTFKQWNKEGNEVTTNGVRKYLIPEFGFVTPLFEEAKPPQRRAQRLYTTRPFFRGFDDQTPESFNFEGVQVTRAVPGVLVILCEGSSRKGFYICSVCGAHNRERTAKHNAPTGTACRGTLQNFSLGHELQTDVVRLQFPNLHDSWDAYSVAYAVLLGTANVLEVPSTDLNVTIAGGSREGESAIIIYDNVPGGAGLVARLEEKRVFKEILEAAKSRVSGDCGCDSSCYGCLRSYRNQFAHAHLNRTQALEILSLKPSPSDVVPPL